MSDSPADNPVPPPGGPVRLNGWKDIASHLDRGVRTVQRWEKEFGLPVRRLGPGRGEGVFAFRHEIDEWQATAQAARARWDSLSPTIDSGGEPADPGAPAGSAEASGRSASGFSITAAGDGPPGSDRWQPPSEDRHRRAGGGDGAGCGLGRLVNVAVPFDVQRRAASGGRRGRRARFLARRRQTRWSCSTRPGAHAGRTNCRRTVDAGFYARQAQVLGATGGVGDIDGDGRREVWFVVVPAGQDATHAKLHLFN